MNFDYIIKQIKDNPYSAFFYTPSILSKSISYIFMEPGEIIPWDRVTIYKLLIINEGS